MLSVIIGILAFQWFFSYAETPHVGKIPFSLLFPLLYSQTSFKHTLQLTSTMKTLVVPTVGVSNVPQLVVQSLLERNAVAYVRKLDPTYMYPYVATNALVTHTPLELHGMERGEVGLVQVHSPVLPGYEVQFAAQISSLAKSEGVDRIVVVDSKDRGERIGWEWYSSDSPLEEMMASLSLGEDGARQVSRTETCPLVALVEGVPVDYFAVRVYEGPNGPAVEDMVRLLASRVGLEGKSQVI